MVNDATIAAATLVIGVGNPYRGDDSVGLRVAEKLAKHLPENVDVMLHSGEGASLITAWKSYQTVYLIDAVASGRPVGTIYRLDAAAETVPAQFFRYSTHAFAVAEAVELARALGDLPPRFYIYGIEGACYDPGSPLDPLVIEAADVVEAEIRARIHVGAGEPHAEVLRHA